MCVEISLITEEELINQLFYRHHCRTNVATKRRDYSMQINHTTRVRTVCIQYTYLRRTEQMEILHSLAQESTISL